MGARIPIYDSVANATKPGGHTINHSLNQNTWRTSQPVRLFGGPGGDIRNVSFEFILSGDNVSSWDFEWYQEFFGDSPHIDRPNETLKYPTNRVFPHKEPNTPWCRETVSIAGAAGAIDHYEITRSLTMQNTNGAGYGHSLWFPMLVHGLWGRIKIRTTTATGGVSPLPILRIYAHIAGHTDVEHYVERLTAPWDYETTDDPAEV
jgi:hypothetical protein